MTLSAHTALAESIVVDGFDRHAAALALFLTDARHRGANDVLLGIVADGSAPRVARERALGRIIVALDGARRTPPARPPHLVVCSGGDRSGVVESVERACA